MSPHDALRAARDQLLALREDHPAAVASFRWPELERFNFAEDWFDRVAEAHPDRLALHLVRADGGEERVGYGALAARSREVAAWLASRGVERGDRVLLMLGNVPALWELFLACIRLGAVMVPTSTLMTEGELVDRVERGRIRHVIAESAQAPRFAAVPGPYRRFAVGPSTHGWVSYAESQGFGEGRWTADPRPSGRDDPLILYFTSGTTSKAKMVTHTHQSYPIGHLSTMYWLGLQPGDVHLNISSPGWAKHAWSCVFAPWLAEATVFVHAFDRFDARATLDVVRRHSVTSLCAPPTVWRALVQHELGERPAALRELLSAGEPLNPEIIERVRRAWGLTIRDGFGQTETTAQVGNPPGQPLSPGSMGRPLPGYAVEVLDPQGVPAAEGELVLRLDPRPLGLMVGYADDPERTARATSEGWYRTGDIVRRDADGFITYVGRADDVFKASDYRISPFELESVLVEHPAVAEAAVVPSPDPLRLAVPKAFVVLRAGHAPDRATALSILAHARARLAPFKRIRRLEFAELPKTISGKIRRTELRAQEQQAAGAGARSAGEFREEDFSELRSDAAPG